MLQKKCGSKIANSTSIMDPHICLFLSRPQINIFVHKKLQVCSEHLCVLVEKQNQNILKFQNMFFLRLQGASDLFVFSVASPPWRPLRLVGWSLRVKYKSLWSYHDIKTKRCLDG